MDLPIGTVILWVNSPTTIPDGWEIYTAAVGKFVRGVPSGGTVGATGGSETHYHTAGAITAAGAHEHPQVDFTWGKSSTNAYLVTKQTPGVYAANGSHNHPGTLKLENNSTNHTHNRDSSNTGTSNNLPPHKRAIYIIKTS